MPRSLRAIGTTHIALGLIAIGAAVVPVRVRARRAFELRTAQRARLRVLVTGAGRTSADTASRGGVGGAGIRRTDLTAGAGLRLDGAEGAFGAASAG